MSIRAKTTVCFLLAAHPLFPAGMQQRFSSPPLYFEPNQNQGASEIRFLARHHRQTLFLRTDGSAVHVLMPAATAGIKTVELALSGASAKTTGVGQALLPSVTHYYAGRSPAAWRPDVPHYGCVRFPHVYGGIDLVWTAQKEIEYRFEVEAGADPALIRFLIKGVDFPRIDESGNLVLQTDAGTLTYERPQAYQSVRGRRIMVAARFRLVKELLRFELGRYDRRLPLVIDPIIRLSTYLGGSGYDAAYGIAEGASGNVYLTGETASPDFPGTATQTRTNRDVFITMLGG